MAEARLQPYGAMNGLVLSGGGARAAYQIGVLSYIAEKAPEVSFPIIAGVSAGSINAAFLAGHQGTSREKLQDLSDCWSDLTVDRVFRSGLGTLGLSGLRWIWTLGGGGTSLGPQVKGLVDTSPLREFLSENVSVEGIAKNIEAGRLRALALTTTRYSTGQTITFVQGQEGIPTWERVRRCGLPTSIGTEHVMASSAIPLVFPAIYVEGDYYGDGSIRQAAPLAPAIHLGADRIFAIATRYGRSPQEAESRATKGYPPPAQVLSMFFNSIFLDTLEQDAERLNRLNRVLEALPPDSPRPDDLRPIKLLVVRPSRDLGKMAEEFRGKLPRSVRFLLRGLGVQRVESPDLLSYLIFEGSFISRVIDLGYEDALSQWPEIEEFFSDS